MNVIAGLDVPFYLAHHTGGHLGNFARNDGNGGDGALAQSNPRRTLDQIMAWSNSFYPGRRVPYPTDQAIDGRGEPLGTLLGDLSTCRYLNRKYAVRGCPGAGITPSARFNTIVLHVPE